MVVVTATVSQGCDLIYPFSFTRPSADGGLADADRGTADSDHKGLEQGAPDASLVCNIGGSEYKAMTLDSVDPCRMCDPVVSRAQWSAAPGCVVTLAGNGNKGFVSGSALTAEFDGPIAVATDGSGRVFVADWSVHRVRLIWQGQVTTVAGNGSAGHVDGLAAGSQLSAPMGLATDGVDRLYISEKNGRRIRLLEQGQVSTVAGNGTAASTDGSALMASFSSPQGLAITPSGTIYVADAGNNRVRLIANGVVSTLGGSTSGWADGLLASAMFSYPTGVEVGPSGAVFVADEKNTIIRRIANGKVSTIAGIPGGGGFVDGTAASAKFNSPHDIAVDSAGTVYVADCGNGRIRKIENGTVSTVAGSWGFADGPFASARFACPISIDLDQFGHLYVADAQNWRIRVLNLNP